MQTGEEQHFATLTVVPNGIVEHLPYRLGDVAHRITASIGATLFYGATLGIEDLLKQADLAMYTSKELGRNGLQFFDLAMQTAILERAALEPVRNWRAGPNSPKTST